MASHVAVLHPSILWDLQQHQEKEKTPSETSRMGCGRWQKRLGAITSCAAALARRGGVEQNPALGKGNFPVTPRREKQRDCWGEMGREAAGTWERGWLATILRDMRDGWRVPCSYRGGSAELCNPGSSTLPCGFCCCWGGVSPQDAARDSVPLCRLFAGSQTQQRPSCRLVPVPVPAGGKRGEPASGKGWMDTTLESVRALPQAPKASAWF